MDAATTFSAQLLTTSAAAYGGVASSLFLERFPEVEVRYAPNALAVWKSHLTQLVLELTAALEAQEPKILTSRVFWAKKAFRARDQSTEDLHRGLICLRQVLNEQLPQIARPSVGQYLDAALDCFGEEVLPGELLSKELLSSELLELDPERPLDRLALRYLHTSLDGDARAAMQLVVQAVDDGLDLEDVYGGILVAAQREVGALWHLGEINVAEEHLVTTTTERALSVLAQRVERCPPRGQTVIAAAVSGNLHGLGARILSDLFEVAGWRAVCLGANVPADDLISSAVYFNADLVLLSAALPTHLKVVRQTIEGIRGLPDQEVKILVGGAALEEIPDLWQRLGADGYAADMVNIVDLGERLVGLPQQPLT